MNRRTLRSSLVALAIVALALAGAAPARAASPPPVLARWTAIAPLPSTSLDGVLDPLTHRMILIPESVGLEGSSRMWVLDTRDPDPAWTLVPTQGTPPPIHSNGSVVMDPVHRRVIVWGGYSFLSDPDPTFWILDLNTEPPTWSQRVGSGTAPKRLRGSCGVYDGLRDRFIFFGGAYDSSGAKYRNDVWTLTVGPASAWWTPIATPAGGPSARYDGAAIYDPRRDRLVIHGGMDVIFGGPRSDAWALNFDGPMEWTRLWQGAGAQDGQRTHHAFYDPVDDRMLLYGGTDSSSGINANYHDEVRALTLAAPGPPVLVADLTGAPHNMGTVAAVFDPDTREMFVHGDEHNPGDRAVTWRFSVTASPPWTRIAGPEYPQAPRFGSAMAWDAPGQRMIYTGGRDCRYFHFDFYSTYYDETRSVTLDERPLWGSLDSGGFRPPSRQYATLLADPATSAMWLFGGNRTTAIYHQPVGIEVFANVYRLDLGGPLPVWTSPAIEGLSPASRDGHTAALDTRRRRMIVFGGRGDVVKNDVWALSMDPPYAWTPLAPAGGPPPPRFFHVAGYDSLEDRMLVFGGVNESWNSLTDLWSLSLSGTPTWTPIAAGGTPPGTLNARPGFFDPVRRRMVVIGRGIGAQTPPTSSIHVLSLDQATPYWTEVPSTGDLYADQMGRSAALDPVSGEIVVLWGGGTLEPVAYVEPVPHRIRFEEAPPPTAVPAPLRPSTITLEAPMPNPAHSAFRVRGALPSSEPATLTLLDATGRTREMRRMTAAGGRFEVAVRTEDLEPGLYFVRVAQADHVATGKIVVVR